MRYNKVILIVLILFMCLFQISACKKNNNTESKENKLSTNNNSETLDVKEDKKEEVIITEDYFKESAIIGDSRSQGLMLYAPLPFKSSFVEKGLNINTALTKQFNHPDGTVTNIIDSFENNEYKSVYIMFGINEIGWPNINVFIDKYKELINTINDLEENCIIYVQSILPVTNDLCNQSGKEIFTNEKINEVNNMLKDMCNELNVKYLNVSESVIGEDGALPSEATTDGIHLNKEYCTKWKEYIISNVE